MKRFQGTARRSLLCLLVLLAGPAMAAQPWQEYSKLIKSREQITSEGPQLFGDSVNLYTGELSFAVSEVSIPGNNALPVALGRKYVVPGEGIPNQPMGDWDIDIPFVGGTFEHDSGWNVTTAQPLARCSSPVEAWEGAPLVAGVQGMSTVDSWEMWHGNQLFTSTTGPQELLFRVAGSPAGPSDGRVYPWLTTQNWTLSCLPTLKSGHAGEGFLAHAPDGTKYHFDWMVVTPVEPFAKPKIQDGVVVDHVFLRDRIRLYPSLVEDRQGNWVRYHWSGSQLTLIEASDGRRIDITWTSGRISQVRTGTRTWHYEYNPWGILLQVTRPDGRQWKYDHSQVAGIIYDPREESVADALGQRRRFVQDQGVICAWMRALKDTPSVLRMTHPTGVTGEFTLGTVRNGRTGVASDCLFPMIGLNDFIPDPPGDTISSTLPIRFDTLALRAKRIVGSGVDLTWRYDYAPPSAQAITDCRPGNCQTTKTSTVTAPDQSATVLTYGIYFQENEGKLLRTEVRQNGGTLRTTDDIYVSNADVVSQPFPARVGISSQGRQDTFASETWRPIRERRITEGGTVFSSTVEQFDALTRPLREKRHNSLGESRTTATEFRDERIRWILGQVAKVTSVDSGLEISRTDFDAFARPSQSWSFGRLDSTTEYDVDGTVSRYVDANGNATRLSSWKRGSPQLIQFADGASVQATVDDHGWLRSVTDENGFTTSYDYDIMGRISGINQPSGDSVAWSPTNISLEYMQAAENGIPAGHWRRSVTTGDARSETYLDALFRPVLTHAFDARNVAGTQSFVRSVLDHEGRTLFTSYPHASLPAATGAWQEFDALGRLVAKSQDSELGLLTSYVSYSGGNSVRIQNPRGQVTVTRYESFDAPAQDNPVLIEHPEGARTAISRDVLGKPLSIRRYSIDGATSLLRKFIYSGDQRLCKSIEPETGATAMGYDAAGNLAWSASGLASLSDACDESAARASGRLATRTYDARSRLKTLAFPDNNGSQSWTYTPDGKTASVTTQNQLGAASATSVFEYNRRRLLVGEESRILNGSTQTLGYAYDSMGDIAGVRYPSGSYVHYAPDALGRPTQVGDQVTQIRYHANGSVASFTYANGIVHSSPQNARQLPLQINDAGVQSLQYQYDQNGNVNAINDAVDAVRNRTMSYDGLDRLARVQSPSFEGTGVFEYGYDALDNLTRVSRGGVTDHSYFYDASNRLTNVRNAAGATVIGLNYDVQGNLSTRNGQAFVFDAGNRLRAATGKERYDYDGFGRRVQAIDTEERGIRSLYGNDGVLRWQYNQRDGKILEYLYVGGRLVAKVEQSAMMGVPVLVAPVMDSTGTFSVGWSDVGAVSYELQASINAGATWAQIYRGGSRTANVQVGAAGSYLYRVRACDGSTCAAWSSVVKTDVIFKPATAPVLVAPGIGLSGTFNIEWSAVASATRYTLEEASSAAGLYTVIYDAGLLRFAVTSRPAGDRFYRVQACNVAGCSPWSAPAKVAVVHPSGSSPVLSVPTTSINGVVAVQWSSIAGSVRYELERAAAQGWAQIYSGAALSFNEQGLASGIHRYRVRTCNAAGCSAWSAEAATTMVRVPAVAPVIALSSTQASGTYSVSWSAIANAATYTLQEQSAGGSWAVAYSGEARSFAVSGKGNGTWSYRTQACNAAGCGPFSVVSATEVLLPPGAPAVSAPGSSATGSFAVTWTSVPTATTYRLEQYSGAAWTEVYAGSGSSFTVGGRSTGTWSYRAVACNASGCGTYSTAVSTQVLLPPPSPSLQAPPSSDSGAYRVSWSTVATAISYDVEQSAGGGWSSVSSGTSTSVDLTGRPNGTYRYRARACNTSGCGGWSAEISVVVVLTPQSAPVLSVEAESGWRVAYPSWTQVHLANEYRLQRRFNGGGWQEVARGAMNRFELSVYPGAHAFRVQACNGEACGPWSADANTFALPDPPSWAYAEYIKGGCRVTWNGSEGASYSTIEDDFGVRVAGNEMVFATCSWAYTVRNCLDGHCSQGKTVQPEGGDPWL